MIGEYLKECRVNSKKSPYDAEKETGINHASIYRWEKNENQPSIYQCIKLADCYGVSLDELVGREFGHTSEHTAKAIQVNNGGNNTQNNYF